MLQHRAAGRRCAGPPASGDNAFTTSADPASPPRVLAARRAQQNAAISPARRLRRRARLPAPYPHSHCALATPAAPSQAGSPRRVSVRPPLCAAPAPGPGSETSPGAPPLSAGEPRSRPALTPHTPLAASPRHPAQPPEPPPTRRPPRRCPFHRARSSPLVPPLAPASARPHRIPRETRANPEAGRDRSGGAWSLAAHNLVDQPGPGPTVSPALFAPRTGAHGAGGTTRLPPRRRCSSSARAPVELVPREQLREASGRISTSSSTRCSPSPCGRCGRPRLRRRRFRASSRPCPARLPLRRCLERRRRTTGSHPRATPPVAIPSGPSVAGSGVDGAVVVAVFFHLRLAAHRAAPNAPRRCASPVAPPASRVSRRTTRYRRPLVASPRGVSTGRPATRGLGAPSAPPASSARARLRFVASGAPPREELLPALLRGRRAHVFAHLYRGNPATVPAQLAGPRLTSPRQRAASAAASFRRPYVSFAPQPTTSSAAPPRAARTRQVVVELVRIRTTPGPPGRVKPPSCEARQNLVVQLSPSNPQDAEPTSEAQRVEATTIASDRSWNLERGTGSSRPLASVDFAVTSDHPSGTWRDIAIAPARRETSSVSGALQSNSSCIRRGLLAAVFCVRGSPPAAADPRRSSRHRNAPLWGGHPTLSVPVYARRRP